MSVNYGRINDSPHSGNLSPEAVYWYYITITDDTYDVVFSACNSDFKPELEIWHGCGESERNFLYGNDNTGDCKITVDYLPAGTYYVRIYRNKSDLGYGNYSFEISLE
jgi:hypothetical protein